MDKSIKVKGTDVIFLAGRTDITIPPLDKSDPSFPLVRQNPIRSDFFKETKPQFVTAKSGEIFTFSASGTIDFFIGSSSNPFNPDGGYSNGSDLLNLDGISGYQGSEGALVGVFLDKNNPGNEFPPDTLNFTSTSVPLHSWFFLRLAIFLTRTEVKK